MLAIQEAKLSNLDIAYTKGKLCFDGSRFRCEGSPRQRAVKDTENSENMTFSEDIARENDSKENLVESGELKIIKFEEEKEEITNTVDNRYLYIQLIKMITIRLKRTSMTSVLFYVKSTKSLRNEMGIAPSRSLEW